MTKQITALSLTGTIGSGFSGKNFWKTLNGGVEQILRDEGIESSKEGG